MSDRRRTGGALLVTLLLIVGLAVGADRVAAWGVARGVAHAVTVGGQDVHGAEVTIHGFPFLTQLARGSVDHATGSLGTGTFGGYQVSDVHLDARGLQPRAPWRVRTIKVDGLVSYATVAHVLSQQTGWDVRLAPAQGKPGAVQATFPTTILGASVDVGAVVTPQVTDGSTLTIHIESVSVGGVAVGIRQLPGGLGDALGNNSIPLTLPDGVTVTSVGVEPGGLRLHAEGQDVPLQSLAR